MCFEEFYRVLQKGRKNMNSRASPLLIKNIDYNNKIKNGEINR